MRVALQRLAIPVVLLAAFIATTVAAGRFGNDDLPEPDTTVTTTSPETPVFSVRRAPELLTSPRAAEELNSALDSWVATLPSNACFVVSQGGEVLYEHQADLPLVPASNMKLLTAVAALEALGPDFRFETRIAALQRPDDDGRLSGDLYVIGGGDPVIMTDAYVATLDPDASMVHTSADTLADQTIASNIADIDGAVVVVADRYDAERQPSSVTQDFIDAGLIGSLGAAMIDQGFLGFKDGYSSQVAEDPPPLSRADDPGEQFAAVFDDLLEARNVRISSRARVEAEAPTNQLVDLVTFSSPPLAEIVQQMLMNSDNTTAEMLVKELSFVASSTTQGSTTSGLLELTSRLNDLGLQGSAAFAFDGSGISAETKVSCDLLHGALDVAVHKDTLRASLPVAGESGTLANRFLGTSAVGRLRAKTGRLAQASALSGYYITDPGVELTFALVVNVTGDEETMTSEQVAGWQRPLPDLLAPYPAGPPLDALGPVGVADLAAELAENDIEANGVDGTDPDGVEPDGVDPDAGESGADDSDVDDGG